MIRKIQKALKKVTGVELHDYGCTLKAYRSHIVKRLELMEICTDFCLL